MLFILKSPGWWSLSPAGALCGAIRALQHPRLAPVTVAFPSGMAEIGAGMSFFFWACFFPSWPRACHLLSLDGGELLESDCSVLLQMHLSLVRSKPARGAVTCLWVLHPDAIQGHVFHSLTAQAEASLELAPAGGRVPGRGCWLQGRAGAMPLFLIAGTVIAACTRGAWSWLGKSCL